jgi:hypothetical protein
LSLFQIAGKALTSGNLGNSLSINYKHLANAAQNLVNALEGEKKPFFKVREEGQFEGSPPTKETFARHEETIKRMKEGLKQEPKIDMKEECVDPEIEIGSEWQSIDGKVVTIDFVKNNLVVWTYEFNDREQITFSTKKEFFIKDFKELKRK